MRQSFLRAMAIIEQRGVTAVGAQHHRYGKTVRAANVSRRWDCELLAAGQVHDGIVRSGRRPVRMAGSAKDKLEEESESRRLRKPEIGEVMSVMQGAAGGQRRDRLGVRARLSFIPPRQTPDSLGLGAGDSSSGCTLWRTSEPWTQKMTSSAMLVAWSATRSRLRATSRASSAWRTISG